MVNKFEIFENLKLGVKVRCILTNDNEVLFVGKDVAKALGYSNSRDAISRHVDEEDKGVVKHDTLGGTQGMICINESGLYSLILSSKLPAAKVFKRWVTKEVLPSIRKTGFYQNTEMGKTLNDLEAAFLLKKAELEGEKECADMIISSQEKVIEALEAQIKDLKNSLKKTEENVTVNIKANAKWDGKYYTLGNGYIFFGENPSKEELEALRER